MKTEQALSFAARMRELELKFSDAAARDGDVYLPNFTPTGPVDAVLIGMEPSLSRWASSPTEASAKVASGFRNFMWSIEDFIVHFSVRRYLLRPGESYHVTDVSKGAMTVRRANQDREERYVRWAALLEEELALVAKPDAHIIAIGQDVRSFLARNMGHIEATPLLHYSPLAASARNAVILGKEEELKSFSEALDIEQILTVAAQVLRENSVPQALAATTLDRLYKVRLTKSRKKLAFAYAETLKRLRK